LVIDDMKPLFMVGNKRSGTSHFVRLLNLHPNVFVAHESDVVWILYQALTGKAFEPYPWDGPLGMNATLEACRETLAEVTPHLREPGAVSTAFFRVLTQLCSQGSAVQDVYLKEQMAWVGDKKPVQQTDPDIQLFLHEHFPEARYVHIIRDPRAVIASMSSAAGWAHVQYWQRSLSEILERWAIHEEWVLQAKKTSPVLTVRFEDLIQRPREIMSDMFKFLDLTLSAEVAEAIARSTSSDANEKYEGVELPRLERAEAIMKLYGYRA
jgi:hypothetical protein